MENKEYQELMEKLYQRKDELPQDASKAKVAVLMGIDKANQEKAKQKKHQIFSLRLCFGCLAILCFMIISLNSNFGLYETLAKVPVIGSVADVFTFHRFSSTNGKTEANISVAKVDELEENVEANDQMQKYARSLVDQYEKEVSETQGEAYYALNSDYTVKYEDNAYLCIEVFTSVEMGGSDQFVETFTIDKETGRTLSLSEYLKKDTALMRRIGDDIKRQMREQMAEDDSLSYWVDDSPLGGYTFTGINGSEDFYLLDAHTIVIQFDKYEVAPGYMGVVEFVVDLDNI